MEQLITDWLRSLGPYAIGLAALFMYRREIKDALFAPKDERAVERLLGSMNEQFAENLRQFAAVRKETGDMVAILRDIHSEMIRNGRGRE